MHTLEEVFVKEFKQEIGAVGYKDIYSIPLPSECSSWVVHDSDLFLVRGVENEHYADLNGLLVKKLPAGYVAKRRVIDKVTRSYKQDENGFVYEDYKVPSGSIVVSSLRDLSLPYSEYANPTDGYGYIDFVRKDGKIEYLYVLPKTVLYKVHQTALALSVKNMKNYSGMGYVTWDNGTIFLHIIPYRPSAQYVGSKILITKHSLDYKNEIDTILNYWQQSGVVPNIPLCTLEDSSNVALKPTAVGYTDYEPVDTLALGDREIYGADSNNEEGVVE